MECFTLGLCATVLEHTRSRRYYFGFGSLVTSGKLFWLLAKDRIAPEILTKGKSGGNKESEVTSQSPKLNRQKLAESISYSSMAMGRLTSLSLCNLYRYVSEKKGEGEGDRNIGDENH